MEDPTQMGVYMENIWDVYGLWNIYGIIWLIFIDNSVSYPLAMSKFAIELALDIVDFPIEHDDLPVRYVNIYQRILPCSIFLLVGGLAHFFISTYSGNVIIPTDLFFRWVGFNHQPYP